MQGDKPQTEAVESAIRDLAAAPPREALEALTAVANRAVIELHKLARQEANARRGQPEWGAWARLANAARSGVLQIAAVRDAMKGLRKLDGSSSAGPGSQAAEVNASDGEGTQ